MAVMELWRRRDLEGAVKTEYVDGNFFTQDSVGNRVGVKVYKDGAEVALTGSVTGYCVLPSGETVSVAGTRSGNQASILVPQSALAYTGPLGIAIKLVDGNTITTLMSIIVVVYRSKTDTVITPSSQIITDWANQIAAALQEVEDASAAQDEKIDDLKSAINNEPIVSSSFAQGARNANDTIVNRADRCTTNISCELSAGDKISVTNPTQRIAVIGGVKNGAFVYDSGWQSGNYEYTVTEQTAGTYFVNFAYSQSGENLTPSDLSGVYVTFDIKTAISELVDDVSNIETAISHQIGRDLVSSVPWERGGIVDGAEAVQMNRVRSDYIDVVDIERIIYNIGNTCRFFFCAYDSSKTFLSNSSWLTGSGTIELGSTIKYVRFVIALVSNTDMGCEVTRQLTATAYYTIGFEASTLNAQHDSLAGLDELDIKSWNIGYVYRDGGVDTEQLNYVCMTAMQKFPYDISVSADDGYQFVVLTFDTSGTVVSGSTWLYDTYIIHAGTYFMLNLSKTTPEAVADISDYTSKIHVRSKATENTAPPATLKKMAVLGDSISTFDGWIESGFNAAHYPKYDVTDVSQMWWYIVADALGITDNIMVSAISQSAYYDYSNAMYPPVYTTSRIERLGTNGAPDVIFVNVGTNDGFAAQNANIAYTENVSELEALTNSTVKGIELTIRKLQTAYPSAKIVMLIPKQVKLTDMPTGYNLERVTKIADEIKACAEMFGVWKTIDLRACGINQTNIETYCGDENTHPNARGMRRMADYILEQLIK